VKLVIAAVGRARAGPVPELVAEYTRRLPWPCAVVEVEEKRPLAGAERRAREAALLKARIPAGATLVALDARGKMLSSEAFAARLGRWQADGTATLCFLIGGADGLDARLIGEADLTLSLGLMTWPHLLARAMLAEQIYRASTILAGHPYHH